MKLYLAYKSSEIFMEGEDNRCLGVFDSKAKAWDYLATTSNFGLSRLSRNGKSREYQFEGELSCYWYVKEVKLNKGETE